MHQVVVSHSVEEYTSWLSLWLAVRSIVEFSCHCSCRCHLFRCHEKKSKPGIHSFGGVRERFIDNEVLGIIDHERIHPNPLTDLKKNIGQSLRYHPREVVEI